MAVIARGEMPTVRGRPRGGSAWIGAGNKARARLRSSGAFSCSFACALMADRAFGGPHLSLRRFIHAAGARAGRGLGDGGCQAPRERQQASGTPLHGCARARTRSRTTGWTVRTLLRQKLTPDVTRTLGPRHTHKWFARRRSGGRFAGSVVCYRNGAPHASTRAVRAPLATTCVYRCDLRAQPSWAQPFPRRIHASASRPADVVVTP